MSLANGTEPSRQTLTEYLSVISAVMGCKELRLSKEEASSLGSLQTWLWNLQRDSSTDDEEFLDDNSKAYLHSFRDNFTRYSLFLRGHGEVVGDSPKVPSNARDRLDPLTSPSLAAEFEKLEEWDTFDVNRVTRLTHGRPLEAVTLEVLHRFDLLEKLKLPREKLRSFLKEVEASYKASNPYHNSTHAADVVQGLASLFAQNSFMAQLTDLEMLSMILSCALHDAGHPGLTNEYLINTGAPAALRYNDRSVNENGHCALGFEILLKRSNNFLEDLPDEQYRFVRRTIIGVVLATDMVDHSRLTKDFAAAVRQLGCDVEKWPEEQRQRALQMLVHACDIGNPAKSLHSSLLWSERILAENFAQGDREREEGLSVSLLCDRQKVDVPKSQLTFLEYVVRPTFEALREFAPATAAAALGNIETAKQHWERMQQCARKEGSVPLFPMDDV